MGLVRTHGIGAKTLGGSFEGGGDAGGVHIHPRTKPAGMLSFFHCSQFIKILSPPTGKDCVGEVI